MEDDLLIYTDGSKTEDGVAMSIAGYHQKRAIETEAYEIPDRSSVFPAELYAILLVVKRSKEGTFPNFITIISDSKSSIQTVSQPTPKNPIAALIQETMNESDKNFYLCWVPSHVGIEGNEMADKAAKEGTKCPTQYPRQSPCSQGRYPGAHKESK